MAETIHDLIVELQQHQRKQFETNSRNKWHLLRAFWKKYPESQQKFILRVAGIDGEPKLLEQYADGDKRRIAWAVRDCLAFAEIDNALNGKQRRLWRNL